MLTFAFLFLIIYIFDRKRDDLDAFSIASAVVVPTIVVFLFGMATAYFGLGIWAAFAELGLLVVSTYLVLNLVLGFKAIRSIAYACAVLVFNVVVVFGLTMVSGAA